MFKVLFKEKEIKSLDGLRALACLMVILAHVVDMHGKGLNIYLQEAMDLGREGVAFFFTISGFIITYLLLKEKDKKDNINIKNFVMRRTIKILPVLYLLILILYIMNYYHLVAISDANFLSSIFFYRNYSDAVYSNYTGHVWSLAVEEHFYLFWPLIILYLSKKNLKYFAIFVIIVSPLIRVGTFYAFPDLNVRLNIMSHCRVDGFMFGALLAIAYMEDGLAWINSKITYPNLTLWAALIFYCFVHPLWKMHSFKGHMILFGFTLNSFLSALIIAILITHKDSVLYRLFNSKILIHLGIISYSLYIWQEFTIYYFSNIFAGIIGSYVFGVLCFMLIEQTFEKIKRRVLH